MDLKSHSYTKHVTEALFKPNPSMDRKGDLYLCGRPWWFLLFSGPSGKSRGFSGDRNLCGLSDNLNLNLVAFDAVFPTIFISNPQNYSGLINQQQSQLNISHLLGV